MKKLITTGFSIAFCILGMGVSAQTDTLIYTGALQSITVPACATLMTVDMAGGQGGSNSNLTGSPTSATGGLGGRVTATIPVVGGSVLQVNVGGKGLSDSAIHSCVIATGGFNGGGTGYGGYNGDNYNAGGGGGASDIRVTPYAFANALVVAGGGGGAGCTGCTGGGVNGGLGGGLTGGNGLGGACASGTDYGFGGTQVKGGDSGSHWGNGASGTFGMGGISMTSGSGVTCGGGGGGGGGYYGGGGGSLAGGGGGSSYTDPSASGVTHTQGYQAGVGYVIIKFNNSTDSLPTISGPTSVCQNSTVQYVCKAVAGAATYTWSVPSGANVISGQGKDTASITFGSVSGTVSVHTNLCPGDSSAITVTVHLLPVVSLSAAKDTICVNNNKDSLMISPLGGTFSGTGVSGSNFNASIAGAGLHKVVYSYTDSNGCSGSDSLLINVNVCAGINEVVNLYNAVKLYPNPFSNEVNVNVDVDGIVNISMFNMLGENMGTWQVSKGNNTINTKGIPTGVYSLEIKTKSGILNKKLVKVN